jgi:ubiquinone biosynthesis protein
MWPFFRLIKKLLLGIPQLIIQQISFADLVASCGPFYIKLAQLMTTRPDLVPKWLIQALIPLQDKVAPEAIYSKLSLIEPPIASGSIAQVYILNQEQFEHVVKIKRPSLKKEISATFNFCQFLIGGTYFTIGKHLCELVDESLQMHLDFIGEVENMELARNYFQTNQKVLIPEVVEDLSNESQIVMTYIRGGPLEASVIIDFLEIVYEMVFVHRFIHGDLHEGNIILTPEKRIAIIDWGTVEIISHEDLTLLLIFFEGLFTGEVEFLAKVMTHQQEVSSTFQKDLSEIFQQNSQLAKILEDLVDLMQKHQVKLRESLLKPLLTLVVAEGIAEKYLDSCLIPFLQDRLF